MLIVELRMTQKKEESDNKEIYNADGNLLSQF